MIRRVVTGTGQHGRATFVSEGEPPRTSRLVHVPGHVSSMVWATASPPAVAADRTESLRSFLPGAGETVALLVTIPPDRGYADPGFDPAAAHAEQLQALPGLADRFDPDDPGMHTTPTVDYCVMVSGEIVLDLGAETRTLRPGDIVVQNSTRHAWRNPGSEPATFFCVMVGTGDSA